MEISETESYKIVESLDEGYGIVEIDGLPQNWIDKPLFSVVLRCFLRKEEFVLKHQLNERTITHKLAEYLNKFFRKFDVDCEYNRMHRETVELGGEFIEKTLHLDEEEADSENETTVFPDIILHNRKNSHSNYLIVEVKKKKYADQKRDKNKETYRDFDKRKIRAYLKELNYYIGIYIEFEGTKIRELKSYFITRV